MESLTTNKDAGIRRSTGVALNDQERRLLKKLMKKEELSASAMIRKAISYYNKKHMRKGE